MPCGGYGFVGQGFTVTLGAHGGRVLSMGVRRKLLRARTWGFFESGIRGIQGFTAWLSGGYSSFVHFLVHPVETYAGLHPEIF